MIYCAQCKTTTKCLNDRENDEERTKNCSKCQRALQYKCTKCNIIYKTISSFKYHKKIRCNKEVEHLDAHSKKLHKCSKCDNSYKYRKHMLHHERSCGRTAFLKCKSCTYTSKDLYHLRAHFRNIHTTFDEKNYKVCDLCGKRYKYTVNFNRHAKVCGTTLDSSEK